MTDFFDERNLPELVEEMHVKGWLDLKNSKVEKLPDNLTVDCTLNLSGSSIKELPENLTVGYELYLYKTTINKIPDSLNFNKNPDNIKGYIFVDDLSKMSFSDKFKSKVIDKRMFKEELYKVIKKEEEEYDF